MMVLIVAYFFGTPCIRCYILFEIIILVIKYFPCAYTHSLMNAWILHYYNYYILPTSKTVKTAKLKLMENKMRVC